MAMDDRYGCRSAQLQVRIQLQTMCGRQHRIDACLSPCLLVHFASSYASNYTRSRSIVEFLSSCACVRVCAIVWELSSNARRFYRRRCADNVDKYTHTHAFTIAALTSIGRHNHNTRCSYVLAHRTHNKRRDAALDERGLMS